MNFRKWLSAVEQRKPSALHLAKYLIRISKEKRSEIFLLPVQEIALRTGLPRGTIHHQLGSLVQIGLIRFLRKRTGRVTPTIEIVHSTAASLSCPAGDARTSNRKRSLAISDSDSSPVALPIGTGGNRES